MLHQVKSRTPSIFKFINQCYAKPSCLFYGENIILSQTGAQQGDPTGPLLFSLTLQNIVSSLSSELNVWYLDDGTLGGTPSSVFNDLNKLIEESSKIGLELNPTKCEIFYCAGNIDPLFQVEIENVLPGIRIKSDCDLELLGAPLLEEGCIPSFTQRFEDMKRMFGRLKQLNSHVAYFLLKNCFNIPKMTYVLRTSPMWKFPDYLNEIDREIKSTLESLLNLKLNDSQWDQTTLPIKYGGIGIRKASDICLPAFLSSANSVKPLMSDILNVNEAQLVIGHLNSALSTWENKYSVEPDTKNIQKFWDEIVIKQVVEQKMNFTESVDIARFKAVQAEGAGTWLDAVPSKQVGTLIESRAFRICIGLRLGCTLVRSHPCICGVASVDEKGLHSLSCQKSVGRFSRHASLNNVLKRALGAGGIPCQLEPVGLTRDVNLRPDGISIVPWENGKHLIWDATCTDTLAPSNLQYSVRESGLCAENACRKKHEKYAMLEENYEFVGFAVETFGVICKEGLGLLKKIGKLLIDKTGNVRAGKYLRQIVGVEVQRGNAACVIGACPISG
uniref:Reverse transcriptase domain-containing protein n=1 Tax=Cacopsylla melanoneura TaxID=428564 RepID=A0A8D8RZN0_9HEMI